MFVRLKLSNKKSNTDNKISDIKIYQQNGYSGGIKWLHLEIFFLVLLETTDIRTFLFYRITARIEHHYFLSMIFKSIFIILI